MVCLLSSRSNQNKEGALKERQTHINSEPGEPLQLTIFRGLKKDHRLPRTRIGKPKLLRQTFSKAHGACGKSNAYEVFFTHWEF